MVSAAGRRLGVICVAALVAGGLFTCRMPPFDEDLSLAVTTIKQLDLAYEIGPVEVCDLNEESTFLFMPGKFPAGTGKAIDDGLFVESQGDTTVVGHVSPDPGGGNYLVVETNANNPLFRFYPRLGEGEFDRYAESVVETSGGGNLYVLQAYPDIPAGDVSLFFDQYDSAAREFNTAALFPIEFDMEQELRTLSGLGGLEWLGMTVHPDASATQDRIAFLGVDPGTSTLYEALGDINELGPSGVATLGNSPFTGALPETVYYSSDGLRSYMSYSDGSGYSNWILDRPGGGTEFAELDVNGRIERVLSTGELFVRTGKRAAIYGPTGGRRASFALGDLEFAFEYYDGNAGRYEMVFTHLYFEPRETGDCDTTAWARVYTIPTSKLDELE